MTNLKTWPELTADPKFDFLQFLSTAARHLADEQEPSDALGNILYMLAGKPHKFINEAAAGGYELAKKGKK